MKGSELVGIFYTVFFFLLFYDKVHNEKPNVLRTPWSVSMACLYQCKQEQGVNMAAH